MESKNNLLNVIGVLIIIISIPIFATGVGLNNLIFTGCAVFFLWIGSFFYNFKRSKVMILAFLITFFVFLLGEILVNIFFDTRLYVSTLDSLMHTNLCLYISLFFLQIGIGLGNWKIRLGHFGGIRPFKSVDVKNIRITCKKLYICFGLCSLATAAEKMILALMLGSYTLTFIDYTSRLPIIITKLAGMADFAFFLYLATIPDPRKSKLIFGLKLLISLVLLLFGTRSIIVMTILLLIIYCIFYENINNIQYVIIPKKVYVIVIIITPFVLVFFDFLMAFRDGRSYMYTDIITSITHITASLGGSVNVITYGYDFDSILPNKYYSLGGVISFFKNNIISSYLFNVPQYGGNTAELAMYGNSFSNALTYLVKPSAYIAGYGMGSSYIAETYHDFGYVGVCFVNIVYGKILVSANKLSDVSYLKNIIILMGSYYILIAPRAYADGFISCYINFSFLFTIILVYILSSNKRNRIR